MFFCITANLFALEEVRGIQTRIVKYTPEGTNNNENRTKALTSPTIFHHDCRFVVQFAGFELTNENNYPVWVEVELYKKQYYDEHQIVPESIINTKSITLAPMENYLWKTNILATCSRNDDDDDDDKNIETADIQGFFIKYRAYKADTGKDYSKKVEKQTIEEEEEEEEERGGGTPITIGTPKNRYDDEESGGGNIGNTVLFMQPVMKEIEKSDADKIIKNLESTVSSKLNSVSYKDVPKAKLKKFGKCGMNPKCWSESAGDEDFQYVLLSLIRMNKKKEITVRLVLINIEDQEVADDSSKTYDSDDDANEKAIFAQIRKMDAFTEIKGGKKSKQEDNEMYKRMKKLEEERLEKERRKRERIEEERARREAWEKYSNQGYSNDNAEKLERARELVLEMCAQGKYNAAIKAIVKVGEIKCECEEDEKNQSLKIKLLNLNKVREQIIKGVEIKNSSLILDNIEAAKALDESIVPGGTDFSQKVNKYAAVGWLARGREMEKANNYVEANEAYEKCVAADPEKIECREWLNSKHKLVKQIYDKASVMKQVNSTKAKQLLRAILQLVTSDNEYYRKAEQALLQLEE